MEPTFSATLQRGQADTVLAGVADAFRGGSGVVLLPLSCAGKDLLTCWVCSVFFSCSDLLAAGEAESFVAEILGETGGVTLLSS